MKGTSFQRPLEFKLYVEGETWNQGDLISGTLTIKNHASEAIGLEGTQVALAHGELKRVRLKSEDAFEVIEAAPLSLPAKIDPGSEIELAWKFQTDRNCPITDKSSSLFLLYGKGANTTQLGQLQLPIIPYSVILEFLKTFTTEFRFIVKSHKASKGRVEVKLDPPDAKAFAMVEDAVTYFHFEGDALEVRYVFNVKKIEATAASFDVKKKKKDLTQTLQATDYKLPNGRIHYDRIQELIKAALGEVEAKITF